MEAKNLFENYKVSKDIGCGINIVNHQIRGEYNLTVSEYCVVDLIVQRKNKNKNTSDLNISTFIGIDAVTVDNIINKLKAKEIITEKNGYYFTKKSIVQKINNEFDYSKEFNEFWTIKNEKGELVTAWPGPKQKAFDLYTKARKAGRSHLFILEQRYWYFKLLSMQTYRQKMIATRFLNINSGELDQDFKGEYENISKKNKIGIEHVSPMSINDFNNEFNG
jgi:hypothetical protein